MGSEFFEKSRARSKRVAEPLTSCAALQEIMMLRLIRFVVVLLVLGAIWVGWWIWSQLPLRELRVHVPTPQNFAWVPDREGLERTLLIGLSPQDRLIEVDFKNNR